MKAWKKWVDMGRHGKTMCSHMAALLGFCQGFRIVLQLSWPPISKSKAQWLGTMGMGKDRNNTTELTKYDQI